jgi:peptidase E
MCLLHHLLSSGSALSLQKTRLKASCHACFVSHAASYEECKRGIEEQYKVLRKISAYAVNVNLFGDDVNTIKKTLKAKLNSMVLVRKRTIPTEPPPLVGEVIANFLRIEGATWSA